MSSVLKRGSKKGKREGGKMWLHTTDSLTQASVVYSVKLVGVTEVAQAKGTDVVREAITKVKFANHIKKSEAGLKGSKLKKVELKISIDSVRVEDVKTKEELYSYPLHRISYCADDKRDKKLFAFIAKDTGMPQHNCYVFECEKMAEELTLTVGQAFELAYRRFLERKAGSEHSQKQMSEMKEKIKTAEEEKEALKQKIAQLELVAQQSSSTNGSVINVVQQNQDKQNDFDLLGGFGSFEMPSSPETQNAFDPFAAPTPEAAVSPAVDSHAFATNPADQSSTQPPAFKGVIPQALPPPPTKQSIKAINRRKASPGATTTVTSPTSVSMPAPSHDLLQIASGLSSSNPFAVSSNGNDHNHFSTNSFDPFAFRPVDLDNTSVREYQDFQESFPRGATINQDSFA